MILIVSIILSVAVSLYIKCVEVTPWLKVVCRSHSLVKNLCRSHSLVKNLYIKCVEVTGWLKIYILSVQKSLVG